MPTYPDLPHKAVLLGSGRGKMRSLTCKAMCLKLYVFLDLQIYNRVNKSNIWKTKLIS